ncbi:MAG: SDR family NAD(P)-dependent oxidoreductase [Anaerolineales bacterium]|nr:SDR family NAD(P)-dependent oxidoreductase [Anaerolineales bacterium]
MSQVKNQPLVEKTAVLSGASKGIGKETAKVFASLGGNVCVLARNREPLDTTATEIRAMIRRDDQFVEIIECDTTKMERLRPLLADFVDQHGVPDYLINLVGYAYPQYVQELSLDDYRKSMEANFYGQLIPTLILLPHFIDARRGHIAFVSSVLGYMGIVGYASYAPTKFAIVGLAEVLRNELKPYGVRISVLYPPDTDTPGFEIENLTKPEETAMMSENIKLMSPEDVGKAFVEGLLQKKYSIFPGGASFVWRINRLFPWLVRWFSDRDYSQARLKLGKD